MPVPEVTYAVNALSRELEFKYRKERFMGFLGGVVNRSIKDGLLPVEQIERFGFKYDVATFERVGLGVDMLGLRQLTPLDQTYTPGVLPLPTRIEITLSVEDQDPLTDGRVIGCLEKSILDSLHTPKGEVQNQPSLHNLIVLTNAVLQHSDLQPFTDY